MLYVLSRQSQMHTISWITSSKCMMKIWEGNQDSIYHELAFSSDSIHIFQMKAGINYNLLDYKSTRRKFYVHILTHAKEFDKHSALLQLTDFVLGFADLTSPQKVLHHVLVIDFIHI